MQKDATELPAVCKVPAGKDPGQGHDLQGQRAETQGGGGRNPKNRMVHSTIKAARRGGLFCEHGDRPAPGSTPGLPKIGRRTHQCKGIISC